jgi:dicarboxylate/amino acid:cation (Na+ or H+) symporter, DAACS family
MPSSDISPRVELRQGTKQTMESIAALQHDLRPTKQAKTSHIVLALVLGALCGMGANVLWGKTALLLQVVHYVTEPIGQVWLRSLIMTVIPLVFCSLSLGVTALGDIRKVGRVGIKTLLFFTMVSMVAALLGLAMVNWIKPGVGLPAESRDLLLQTYRQQAHETAAGNLHGAFGVGMFVNIVPRNPFAAAGQGDMLAVIFFSLIFGVALGLVPVAQSQTLRDTIRGIGSVVIVIIDLVMKVAPAGVFALVFSVAARFGIDLLEKLGWYVLTVIVGLIIFETAVYSVLIRVLAKLSPLDFFRRAKDAIVTAFSTSSSNATLPTTLRVSTTTLGLPESVCSFVIPMGASMCMNGTALFEGVTALFIAQVFGVHLTLPAQALVIGMSVMASVGAAGVPSGAIPILILVLEAVGIPGEGVAMVIGVDRILDMCRTAVNVTGDMIGAAYVSRSESGKALSQEASAAGGGVSGANPPCALH